MVAVVLEDLRMKMRRLKQRQMALSILAMPRRPLWTWRVPKLEFDLSSIAEAFYELPRALREMLKLEGEMAAYCERHYGSSQQEGL